MRVAILAALMVIGCFAAYLFLTQRDNGPATDSRRRSKPNRSMGWWPWGTSSKAKEEEEPPAPPELLVNPYVEGQSSTAATPPPPPQAVTVVVEHAPKQGWWYFLAGSAGFVAGAVATWVTGRIFSSRKETSRRANVAEPSGNAVSGKLATTPSRYRA